MEFYQKYELIDPLPGEGTKSFRARQIATGREVLVHLLVGGRTPENDKLLVRLRGIPALSFSKLIEVGENEGTPFVVTAAPPFVHLEEWLSEQERSALTDSQKLARAGTWRIPVAPPSVGGTQQVGSSGTGLPACLPTADPPPPPAPPGEFTRLFQTGASPTQQGNAPAPAAPPSAPPGEFTRLFQTGASPTQQGKAAPAAPASEFSGMFQAPPQSPIGEPAPPPPAPAPPAAPGEFTRLFNSPLPEGSLGRPAGGTDWPPPAPKPQEAGAFTRMFQSQERPAQPAQEPGQQGGEFTRFFKVPGPQGPQFPSAPLPPGSPGALPPQAPSSPPPPPARSAAPGEFTRMFGQPGPGAAPPAAPGLPSMPSPPQPQAPAPPAVRSYGDSATGAFARPAAPPAAGGPPAEPAGPSEYTMLISRTGPGAPAGTPQAPSAQHGGGGGGSPVVQVNVQGPQMPGVYLPQPQMPYVPQPQLPSVPGVYVQQPQIPQLRTPQLSVPQPSTPQATLTAGAPSSTNWLLIAIIGLGAFLLGLVVMLLVMKK